MIFKQNLTNNSHRQVEKDSKTDAGTEKWVPLREMTKIPFCMILCKNQKTETVTYAVEAQ